MVDTRITTCTRTITTETRCMEIECIKGEDSTTMGIVAGIEAALTIRMNKTLQILLKIREVSHTRTTRIVVNMAEQMEDQATGTVIKARMKAVAIEGVILADSVQAAKEVTTVDLEEAVCHQTSSVSAAKLKAITSETAPKMAMHFTTQPRERVSLRLTCGKV